jgi:hypothetical protein
MQAYRRRFFLLSTMLGTCGFLGGNGAGFAFGSSFSSASRTGHYSIASGQRSSANFRRVYSMRQCASSSGRLGS